ncbi:HAMP domain-containing sensor histidine kinase [Tropicimonas sp. TH_r6]|uniref:sensor histidine kinase n=1 Tax=Tropicimonas sp. TH_r6 TaxID=3082085 RepID=UPI002954A76D|nr:HAMP domain-containing sensor histidine kinase [Tropicimonas sp. TH_r6]MDV7145829.1 HAMP domain-containing sensor histidine kinase [Tropicimonas sp. TH_r6]
MKSYSLRWRLLATGTIAVVVALAIAAVGISLLFSAHVERRALAELSVQLDQVLSGVERDADGQIYLSNQPADPRFSRPLGGLYWQIAVEGGLLRSRSLWDHEIPLPDDELPDGGEHVHMLKGPAEQSILTVERSVILPARLGETPMRAAVAVDRADLRAASHEFASDLLPYLAVLAAVLILAMAAQVAIGLRPLGRVEARIASIRSGSSQRLGEDFPTEVIPLAKKVDALLAEREEEVSRAGMRAADLAHGFKTPLQAMLGEAGRLRAGGQVEHAEAIEETVETMRGHVDRELMRARASLHRKTAQCGVGEVVEAVLRVLRRTSPGNEKNWHVDIPPDLSMAADAGDLTEILGAIAENAARHAKSRVGIDAHVDGQMVEIRIVDDGPGIPPDRLAEITRRGVRADETSAGSGFGLAIASELAETLGGRLDLHPGTPGLSVHVILPKG